MCGLPRLWEGMHHHVNPTCLRWRLVTWWHLPLGITSFGEKWARKSSNLGVWSNKKRGSRPRTDTRFVDFSIGITIFFCTNEQEKTVKFTHERWEFRPSKTHQKARQVANVGIHSCPEGLLGYVRDMALVPENLKILGGRKKTMFQKMTLMKTAVK